MKRRTPSWRAWLFVGLVLGLPAMLAAQEPTAPPAPQADNLDNRLVCIGALAGAHIYTTYGYVGGIADLYAAESGYDAARVQSLMKEVIGLSDVSIQQLRKVQERDVANEDKQTIADVIDIYGLLKKEAQALSDFTKSGAQSDLDEFEAARAAAWPKIKKVLAIPD